MADTGSIQGQVLNQRDNQPIAGASAQLSGEGVEQNATSGSDGRFKIDGLAPGSYDLVLQQEGFYDGTYGPLMVFPGDTTSITVALQPKDI